MLISISGISTHKQAKKGKRDRKSARQWRLQNSQKVEERRRRIMRKVVAIGNEKKI